MKQNSRFFTHTVSLWTLFIMGNAVIYLPTKNSDEFTFLGLISASLFGAVLYFAALPIAKRLYGADNMANRKAFCKILFATAFSAIAVFAVFCAAAALGDFTVFIKNVVLKDTSLFFISLIFLIVITFFCFRRQEDVLKFFLVAFWFVLVVVIFFFAATAFKFDFRNIFVFKLPKFKELFSQAKPYILNPVIPSVLLPFYNAAVFGKTRVWSGALGYAFGYAMLAVCVIGSVLLFGSEFAGELSFPYSAAVSTVSIGRLFTRLDGFSYFLYFVSALARITVCIFIAKISVKRINDMFYNR